MQYDKTFKEEAVKLSDEIGLNAAANQLGIPYYTLSGWRNKRKNIRKPHMLEAVTNVYLMMPRIKRYASLKKRF